MVETLQMGGIKLCKPGKEDLFVVCTNAFGHQV